MKILIAILSLFSFTLTYAAELLVNCKADNHEYRSGRIVLHSDLTQQPQLYLLHNISKKTIIINHQIQHRSASAGWGSELRGNNWSALMVAQPKFSLVCMTEQDQKTIYVDCKTFIELCYFSGFKDEDKSGNGTYWVAEDQPLKLLMDQISKRNIQLYVSS